jgi:transposase-like protein
VIKKGFRKRKSGKVHRYECKECGRKFVLHESGFHKMKNKPKIITLALDLYFKGVSLRKIKDHLKQFHGVEVSHMAIYKWIEKYVNL